MIFKSVLVFLYVLEFCMHIAQIDRSRRLITRDVVILEGFITAVIIYGIFNWL